MPVHGHCAVKPNVGASPSRVIKLCTRWTGLFGLALKLLYPEAR
jgi:hypothetical protein